MKKITVQKGGWNWYSFIGGPFWYMIKGMFGYGLVLLLITLITIGIGLIPVWIYCGAKGNSDFYHYLKKKNIYIHS